MVTKEEAKYFSRKLIKQIKVFLEDNPDKERVEIGIKRESDGDYIWYRDWHIVPPTKPKCSLCGQAMLESGICDPDGRLGYPLWFCDNKKCRKMLIVRYEKEIEEYRRGEGQTNLLKAIMDKMNIPLSYRNKTLSNLEWNGKNAIREKMKSGSNLFIYGNTGTGKTHLAVALLIDYGRYKPHKYRFENVPIMFSNIQRMVDNDENYTKIIDNTNMYDTLVLDDLGAGKITDYRREVLYNIISGRELTGKQTIITTNMTLRQIGKEFDDRLASRIDGYTHVSMRGEDQRKVRKTA